MVIRKRIDIARLRLTLQCDMSFAVRFDKSFLRKEYITIYSTHEKYQFRRLQLRQTCSDIVKGNLILCLLCQRRMKNNFCFLCGGKSEKIHGI